MIAWLASKSCFMIFCWFVWLQWFLLMYYRVKDLVKHCVNIKIIFFTRVFPEGGA